MHSDNVWRWGQQSSSELWTFRETERSEPLIVTRSFDTLVVVWVDTKLLFSEIARGRHLFLDGIWRGGQSKLPRRRQRA